MSDSTTRLTDAARAYYNAIASGDTDMEDCARQQLHRAAFQYGEREFTPRAPLVLNRVVRRTARRSKS